MLNIRFTNSLGVFVFIEVIIFLSQSKSCLILVEDIHRRVASICFHVQGKQTVFHGATHFFTQLVPGRYILNIIQCLAQWFNTFRIAACSI